MRWRIAVLLLTGLWLVACALPPNDGSGGFAHALGGDHPITDSDCVASGFKITNDGKTRAVDGFFHIDCEPQPHSFQIVFVLQWTPTHKPRGLPRQWTSIGDSAMSTTIPDDVGETFTVGPVGCQEGRWRVHVVADGMTRAGNVRHDVVNGPLPAERIKDCSVTHGSGWSS
jgi:hypothetical protein